MKYLKILKIFLEALKKDLALEKSMKQNNHCATRAHTLQRVWELPLVVDDHGRSFELAWEVTFSDFDACNDRHASESSHSSGHKVLASTRRADAA